METDKTSPKKNRKRLKKLYQQIREQVEFYLSDANLQKDRFFKQQMSSSPDGCIDLELFLRCNKILALTSDIDVLVNAVATSKKLLVKKEAKAVGRLVPYAEPKDVDERTVYVECLPRGIDRDWIRNVFSGCGSIVYISLPRFKSTGDIKGFAFVEFDTAKAAKEACELMNHPPAESVDKVGRFPRNKQLKQLEKQVQIQETCVGRKRHASESEMDLTCAPKVKRKRTMSEGKGDEIDPQHVSVVSELSAQPEAATTKKKRRKSSDSGNAKLGAESKSQIPDKSGETPAKTAKVKKDSKDVKQSLDSGDVAASVKQPKKKEGIAESDETKSKTVTKKRKAEKESLEPSEKKTKKVKICTDAEVETEVKEPAKDAKETKEEKKKRKRHKKSKNKNKATAKDIPELRVIPKEEWLKLRADYLQIQKSSMNQLKEKLKELQTSEKKEEKDWQKKRELTGSSNPTAMDAVSDATKKGEPEFVPGVIVKVTTEQPSNRKDLKEHIWALGSIAYIDFKEGDLSGHVRCNDVQTALAISETKVSGFLFQRLSGNDEKAYWEKLAEDRNKKLSTKTRSKQRGRDKILQKADVAYEKTKKPLHIIFD